MRSPRGSSLNTSSLNSFLSNFVYITFALFLFVMFSIAPVSSVFFNRAKTLFHRLESCIRDYRLPTACNIGLITEFKNKAMEAVKLAINLGCAETQNAIAITAEKKHHSYAQLLRSAFQLSSLLQSDGRDTVDRVGTNGHHDSGEEGFIGLSKVIWSLQILCDLLLPQTLFPIHLTGSFDLGLGFRVLSDHNLSWYQCPERIGSSNNYVRLNYTTLEVPKSG